MDVLITFFIICSCLLIFIASFFLGIIFVKKGKKINFSPVASGTIYIVITPCLLVIGFGLILYGVFRVLPLFSLIGAIMLIGSGLLAAAGGLWIASAMRELDKAAKSLSNGYG